MKNKNIDDIYSAYNKELYIYAYSLCKNHYIAEELVSETFYRAILSINKCSGDIKYWLFKVAKNVWYDGLRKEKTKSKYSFDGNNLKDSKDIVDTIIINEKRLYIYRCILLLPQNYQEITVLFYYCGFTLNQIAKSMGITPGATRTLLYRARKKLKSIMEDSNYEEF